MPVPPPWTSEQYGKRPRKRAKKSGRRGAARGRFPVAKLQPGLSSPNSLTRFNDRYDHRAGDRVLQRVAALVAEIGDQPLDLAGRYGGEEFVLVLPGCTLAHARERLQNLRREVDDQRRDHTGLPAGNRTQCRRADTNG